VSEGARKSARGGRRLAWALFGFIAALWVVALVFIWLGRSVGQGSTWGTAGSLGQTMFILVMGSFPAVGVLLATRQPENAIGWILMAIGLVWALDGVFTGYYAYTLLVRPGSLPGGALVLALDQWLWAPALGLSGTFLILLFPDGHLPSRRWRPLAWITAGVLVVASASILFTPGPMTDADFPNVINPIGIPALAGLLDFLKITILLIPLCMIACAVALIGRFRRSSGTERLQLKWLSFAAAIVAVGYLLVLPLSLVVAQGDASPPTWLAILQDVALFTFVLIPAACAVAMLRYHLYDFDVVVKKTVQYGLLVAVFSGLAALAVLLIPTAVMGVGSGSGFIPVLLAAVVISALFVPARRFARRLADRVVYGGRATPYEVLSEFSERLSESYAAEDVLPRMAEIMRRAVGADVARVWLSIGGRLRPASVSPMEAGLGDALPLPDDRLPAFDRGQDGFEVRHQGELLGALSVSMPANDPMDPAKAKLVQDLAAQAGLVLRNARLIEDLRESRRRIVSAQDARAKALERNIHDGAQQQLVALNVQLGLAKTLAPRDAEATVRLLSDLQDRTEETLADLRDLARGIYPPLLADKGLGAALEAQARRSAIPVEVRSDGVGRFSQEAESAVYFSVLEALQNVAKYARASRATVTLSNGSGTLEFEVADDGVGFDAAQTSYGTGLQGMADRVAAIGGTLDVRAAPGEGTTVTGRVPLAASPAR
jgi:signal transduction histidine kinase